jgi:hypothetical protein
MRVLTEEQREHKRTADRNRMRELKARARGASPSIPSELKGRIHLVIGDTQVKPGVPTDHLGWIGRYIVDQFAGQDLAVIHLGDHWDMPSLSSYDKGKKSFEGRRYKADIKAGNEAFRLLNAPLWRYNAGLAYEAQWCPELHFLYGNHEARITRAANDSPELDGVLTLDDLHTYGWNTHAFREILWLDSIAYSHFFYHPKTGKPYGGENLYNRLKTIGHSFTMGHQQGKDIASRAVGDKMHRGLVLGSTYLHDETYLGPQVQNYWRGIAVCHQVEDGNYDLMEVSLDFLCRKYEGVALSDFMNRIARAA